MIRALINGRGSKKDRPGKESHPMILPKTLRRDLALLALIPAIYLSACCGVHALDAGPAIAHTLDKHPAGPVLVRELVEVDAPGLESLGTYTVYAYCPCAKCCGQWSGGLTASGTVPEEGRTVAADWDVLPAGTEIYIEGVGWRVVEDTGAGIDGQALDIYMDSHGAALDFGVQEMEVYREQDRES